jgi:hypothetical protein
MGITESQLRRIIRQETKNLQEAGWTMDPEKDAMLRAWGEFSTKCFPHVAKLAHACGLSSVEAMDQIREVFMLPDGAGPDGAL